MKKMPLGNTGILVPPICMGVLTVGRTQLNLPLKRGAALVRYAIERGINFLDTAEYYETYPYIAEAFRDMRENPNPNMDVKVSPDDVVIASKSLTADYAGMSRAIDDCRAALLREQIEIFLLHEVREAPDFEQRSGAWQALIDAKKAGKVRAIGISTHHIDVAQMAADIEELNILFPLINFKSLGIRKGADAGEKEEMAAAIKAAGRAGKGIFAMKALGGGNLAADYVDALDYVSSLEGITSIAMGIGTEKDVDDAIDYFEGRLPKSYQPDVSKKRMRVDRGDCEGCGACTRRCASGAIALDREGIATIDEALCVTCGYCAYVCPTRALIMY